MYNAHFEKLVIKHTNTKYFHTLNFSIADILYSGHLVIMDRLSSKQTNPGQTLIANPLYSGHFYSGHSL